MLSRLSPLKANRADDTKKLAAGFPRRRVVSSILLQSF